MHAGPVLKPARIVRVARLKPLLDQGARWGLCDRDRWTPLGLAVVSRSAETAKELEVDTIGKTVEPANDEAKRYFTFRDCNFEAPQRQQSTGGGLPGFGF